MRRKRQLLSAEETVAILDAATAGVLAVADKDDYPYAVPLSFAYEGGSIFFHSANAGYKLDAIDHSDKASFCVIADDDVVQETFTTHFRSAIVFGRISVVTDDERKRHALWLLAEKYSPDCLDAADAEIDGSWDRTCVLELKIEEMTGKAALEIIKERGRKTQPAE
jgi:nitroimidazol reductase NimA-like FMN-containing flavoprotein (pyridoxamine 5'-phosphate oxidase superfamily)